MRAFLLFLVFPAVGLAAPLSGTVRESGAAVKGAEITAFALPPEFPLPAFVVRLVPHSNVSLCAAEAAVVERLVGSGPAGLTELARGRTDRDGAFRFEVPDDAAKRVVLLRVKAAGVSVWQGVVMSAAMTIDLAPNPLEWRIVRGGLPVGGARIQGVGFPFDARTDEEGRVVVRDLGDRRLPVRISAPGSAPVLALLSTPASVPESDRVIQLPASLRKAEITLEPYVEVRGSVSFEGAPAADVDVRVKSTGCSSVSTRSDAEGRFHLASVPSRRLEIEAAHATGWTSKDVNVDGKSEVVLTLKPTGSVVGEIRPPPKDAAVRARQGSRGPVVTARVEDGRYALPRLPVGTWDLELVEGRQGFVMGQVQVAPGETSRRDFDVAETAWLRGVVREGEGAPVPAAQLTLKPERSTHGRTFSASTDAEGRFKLPVPGEGAWKLEVRARDHFEREVALTAGQDTVELVLQRAGRCALTVRDDKGQAVESAHVDFVGPRNVGGVCSRGKCEVDGLPDGTYEVKVWQKPNVVANVSASQTVTLENARCPPLAFTLKRLRTVRGTVRTTGGRPAQGVEVRTAAPLQVDVLAVTDVKGRFEFPIDRKGDTVVELVGKGFVAPEGARFVVRPGRKPVQWRVEERPYLFGRVLDPDGKVARFLKVNGVPGLHDGTFGVNVPKGKSALLVIESYGGVRKVLRVPLRGKNVQSLGDVQLGPGQTLSGEVRDRLTGAPLADVPVTIVSGGGSLVDVRRVVRTDSDGRFSATKLDEGELSVELDVEGYARLVQKAQDGAQLRLELRPQGTEAR